MNSNLEEKNADRFIVNHDRRQTAGNLHEIGFPILNRCSLDGRSVDSAVCPYANINLIVALTLTPQMLPSNTP